MTVKRRRRRTGKEGRGERGRGRERWWVGDEKW